MRALTLAGTTAGPQGLSPSAQAVTNKLRAAAASVDAAIAAVDAGWTNRIARNPQCAKGPLKQVCETEIDLSKDASPARPDSLDPHFADSMFNFDQRGPQVGSMAPDFTLQNLDGETVRLSDVLKDKPVVLITGSISCTVFRRLAMMQMEQLRRDYGNGVRVLMLYVDEIHPALDASPIARGQWTHTDNVTDGILIRKPQTAEQRRTLALLAAERFGLSTADIVMDGMDNRVWDSYMRLPNASFVIGKDGKIAFRELWAFRTTGTGPRTALQELVAKLLNAAK